MKEARRIAADCRICGDATAFELVSSHIAAYEDSPPTEYSLWKCGICDDVALFEREDFGSEGGFDDDQYNRLYPPQKRELSFKVPVVVGESYKEASKCEAAKAWTACAVMVGRTLEAVALQYDSKEKNLRSALTKMLEKGIISQDMYEWANELRLIRNVGAHAVESGVSSDDAKEGLDFAQAILEILYDLRPRFEKMRARRSGIA